MAKDEARYEHDQERDLWERILQKFQESEFKETLDLMDEYISKFGYDKKVVDLRKKMPGFQDAADSAEVPAEKPLRKEDTNPFELAKYLDNKQAKASQNEAKGGALKDIQSEVDMLSEQNRATKKDAMPAESRLPAKPQPAAGKSDWFPPADDTFMKQLELELEKAKGKPTFKPESTQPSFKQKAVAVPARPRPSTFPQVKPDQRHAEPAVRPSPGGKIVKTIKGFPVWLDVLVVLTVILVIFQFANPFAASAPAVRSPSSMRTGMTAGADRSGAAAGSAALDARYNAYLEQLDRLLEVGEYRKALQVIIKAKKIKTDQRLWAIIEKAEGFAAEDQSRLEGYLRQAEQLAEQGQFPKALQMAARALNLEDQERLRQVEERIEQKIVAAQLAAAGVNDEADFASAQQQDTREAYEQYLRVHPRSGHSREAMRRIVEFDRQELEEIDKRIVERTAATRTLRLRRDYQRMGAAEITATWRKFEPGESKIERKIIAGDRVAIDYTTGLMWHAVDNPVDLDKARLWVCRRFAGYADWRLPTTDEARSLLAVMPLLVDAGVELKIWTGDGSPLDSQSFWAVRFPGGTFSLWRSDEFNALFPVRTVKGE